jgi:oxygen-independent coproporphyrinogen-3 oxidase
MATVAARQDASPDLAALTERFGRPGPRYTSYPTVPYWDDGFGEEEYLGALDDLRERTGDAVSVYVHLPFCAKRCFYCGCHALVRHSRTPMDRYLDHVERELEMVAGRIGSRRRVTQIHWGGGTPNYLEEDQTRRLMGLLRGAFRVDDDAEISVEMDPRIATAEQVGLLRELGFTRVSLGVQDMDQRVQAAIGRLQSQEETEELYETCRDAGFDSVNLDLVYGLPHQTVESFSSTVDRICELAPDRVATFSYAHVPQLRPNQRAMDADALPSPDEKMRIFEDTVERFSDRGYRWIGLDHFAREEDDLAVAAAEGRLVRNFMGYSTLAAPHVLALGMSGIGEVAGRFLQMDSNLASYREGIAEGRLPVTRGHRMSRDDAFRQRVIQHLMCNAVVPFDLTEEEFGERVDEALEPEMRALRQLEGEGLVELTEEDVRVTWTGRFFIRNVAMVLDRYLRGPGDDPVFSSTV